MTFMVTAPLLPHTALKTTSTDYHSDCRGCRPPTGSRPASLGGRMRRSGKLVRQAGRLKGLL